MAAHSGATFVADLKSKSWYPQYAQVFADAGIPEWIPDALVANEDPSLSLGAAGTDAPSYGLFQINLAAHPNISQAQAQNPIASAQFAAAAIQPILQAHPEYQDPANVNQLIKSLESAGWPGGSGLVQLPDGTWYDETADRVSDAQNVITQLGGVPAPNAYVSSGAVTDGTPNPAPGSAPSTSAANANAQTGADTATPADPFGLNALWTNVQAFIGNLEQNIFFGAIALALIAGGFAWLAATQANTPEGRDIIKGAAAA